MSYGTAICTWFVADDAADGTFFPQIGLRSDAPAAQAVYRRCTVCFFASSLALNPEAQHILFTNTLVPTVDGIDLAVLFERWGVETVTLPITYRLPKGASSSWGNQFYIFDIMDYLATKGGAARTIVLDSDCLWLRPVSQEMDAAIDLHGALTLDTGEYAAGAQINGSTREQMAHFLREHRGPDRPWTPYYGGEIYAARQDMTERLSVRARLLWQDVLAQGEDAPREEAHFLSILYALEGIEDRTANAFIRRMWTTFHHNNLQKSDETLAIWHLPSEKKTGFADMFKHIAARPELLPAKDGKAMGLDFASYSRTMGWPRRRPVKFARDLYAKFAEKVAV